MKTVLKTVVLVIIMMAATQIYGQASFGTGTVVSAPAGTSFYLWDNNKAFVPNQVALTSTTDATTVPTPPNGGIVYNTATAGSGTTAVTPGYYYNSGTTVSPVWVRYVAVGSQGTTGQMLTSQGTGVTPIWSNPGRLSNIVTYTSGSGTYTVPVGVTAIQVKIVGAGGAGGSANYSACAGLYHVGSGGGSGGYCEKFISSPAASYSYSVGAGGTPNTTTCGNGTAGGSAGGNTTFGTSFLTANGGAGGLNSYSGFIINGGAGGAATGGDINISGTRGGAAVSSSYLSAGYGANSIFGGGGSGLGAINGTSAGFAGTSPGAGGSGAAAYSGGWQPGGSGANGIIIIYEYK